MCDKQNTMNKMCFDRSGFGSEKMSFQDVGKIDRTIKMTDIDAFFEKSVEHKKQLKGYTSFVVPGAYYEYKIDLMFLSDLICLF